MRPATIIWFERLYLASLAIGVANMLLARDELPEMFFSTLGIIVMAAMFALGATLTLLVSRKGNRAAQWVLVGVFAFGLLNLLWWIAGSAEPIDMAWNEWGLWIVETVGIGLLFTPSARGWMRWRRQGPVASDSLQRTFE